MVRRSVGGTVPLVHLHLGWSDIRLGPNNEANKFKERISKFEKIKLFCLFYASKALNAHWGGRPLGKLHISPCSNASTGAAGKLEEIWGWIVASKRRREICSDNSRRQTDLAESAVSKYLRMDAFKPALAETFGWCITSASCSVTFHPKWNGKLVKSAIHEISFLRIPLHGGKKPSSISVVGCGKTSVFTRDFYPSSPLFISDSYLTHFISRYTSSWRLFADSRLIWQNICTDGRVTFFGGNGISSTNSHPK